MHRKLSSITAAIGLLLALAAVSFGQITGGQVTGTVLDATGAVVPSATVTLTNKATGQVITTQTTGSGSYSYPNVPSGDYTLSVENTGFQPVTQDLKVALNQTTSVDVTLQAGQLTGETVTVTAASEALVQADTSQLGKSYETELVSDLPLFGNQNTLALLSPNVVEQASGTAGTGGSVGGTRPRTNIFIVDGVENNDPSVTGPATSVIQDAIQEFTLLTNNFNAEFGQGGGGQFVTITKSGTNEFHGNGFVYTQNQTLNAASTNQEAQLRSGELSEKPRLRDTRFGFTLGGPIVRNKLFFFGAIEQQENNEEGTSASFLAPTPTGLGQVGGLPGVSPFVINLLRNNLALANTASTTVNVLGTPIPFGSVVLNIPQGFSQTLVQANIDWTPNQKDQFRFRFSPTKYRAEQPGNGNITFNNLLAYDTRLFSATWVRTFSPSVVNDLRLAYRRVTEDYPLINNDLNSFPNITVAPLNLALGPNENLPQGGFNNNYQVFDTLSYIRGQHSFRFGGEYRNLIFTSFFLPRGRGDYVYTTFDELVLDRAPTSVDLRGVGSGGFTGNQQRYYVFGQDDWKVTPNLTLNLGLRYEYATLPRDAKLQALNRISNAPGFVEFNVPETDKNNFAPRVGFAYSPNFESGVLGAIFGERGRSAIRGNFSMSYAEVFQNLVLLQLPPQFQQELDVATANAGFGLNLNTRFLEQGGVPPRPIPPTTQAAARAGTGSLISDQKFGEIYSFSLGFQRELTRSTAIEVRYLGTRGRHLPVQIRRNEPLVTPSIFTIPTFIGTTPTAAQLTGRQTLGDIFSDPRTFFFPGDVFGFGGFITAFDPVGNSNYDSGSVSVTRRFTQGFAFTSAYTFSKTLDNSTNELFTSRVNPRRPEYGRDLTNEKGLSALDIPHRFVFAGNYELPFFRNSENAFLRTVLGGYELAGIFQAQSGQPITPLAGIDSNLNFDVAGDRAILNPAGQEGVGSGVRALAVIGGVVTPVDLGDPRTVAYQAINPNAQYIQTGFGARSTAGRNTLRSQGFNRTDLTALKNFRFGQDNQYNLQVGAEVFNLLNQRIRTITGVGATTSAFANVGSSLFNDYRIGDFDGRTVQLRAKFIF